MSRLLLQQLDSVARVAEMSKAGRLLHHPYRYARAMLFQKLGYPRSGKEKVVTAQLFFGKDMQVALPASTDIYLTGGKSHDSEIRLARFLIQHLQPGDGFLDIGAHYGYFTLLAAELVGEAGRVKSFEPTAKSFGLLAANTRSLPQAEVTQKAVSDKPGIITFYQFPNLYSEYNSRDVAQFEGEAWFKAARPEKTEVAATSIDEITADDVFRPKIIKIDVEGAEHSVIQGGVAFLQNESPLVVMEYLEPGRHNEGHRQAAGLLQEWGYRAQVIHRDGLLLPAQDIEAHLAAHQLESDNIVFMKSL